MLKTTDQDTDVGVIIGRFQVHELHPGHIELIQNVCNEHEKVIIFLGLSPLMVTQNNPLDFESRKQMILDSFPGVIVLYIKDVNSDDIWSKELDEKIKDVTGPNQTVTLYGSRDSFIRHYSGKYKTKELVQQSFISGSEIRKNISKKVKNTPEFRAGVIWAAYNQYPKCYTTVDVIIYNSDHSKILLARKPKETLYRFVGGFADPVSASFEDDAIREVKEETGLNAKDLKYISSFKINDWRYANEVDKIKTLLYTCVVYEGTPQANDDICEVRWFDINQITSEQLVKEHARMFEFFKSGKV